MNKGKVRDNEQLKYKLQLIQKILCATGHSKDSEFARSLHSKNGRALYRMLEKLGFKDK